MGEILFPAWDPVIVQLGPLQIRWYSMGYVVGFLVGHYIFTKLARSRFFPLPAEKVPDLIFWLVIGVMLGGRIGYCLFYKPDLLLSWRVIAVWEGGLSFHGGLLGVIAVGILWSRAQKISTWRLFDCFAMAITPGVFCVRIANFINGELYGRITDDSVPWAMRFPTDPIAMHKMGITEAAGIRDREGALRAAIENGTWAQVRDGGEVPLRHPSQLYEALGEGLIMGLILLAVYMATRKKPLGMGVYSGIFLLGYGVFRFIVEEYRQPDAQFRGPDDPLGTVLGPLTMGQVLCAGMIIAGAMIMWLRWKHRAPVPAADVEPTEEASGG